MRKTAYLVSVAICVGCFTACSEQRDSRDDYVVQTAANQQDPNPTRDPQVQEGYDRHQREHQERQAAAREAARETERERGFRVDKSGAGGSGIPTSGGYPPAGIDPNTNKNNP